MCAVEKSGISAAAVKWGLGALSVVFLAVGEQLISFNYSGLIAGDKWELRRLGGAVGIAASLALWGYLQKRVGDVSGEKYLQLQKEFFALLSSVRSPKDEAPTTTPIGE